VTPEQVRALFAKMVTGGKLSSGERALLAEVRAQSHNGSASGGPGPGPAAGSYIVFALRGGKIAPVPIRTGLTDQDYIEVTSGLTDRDTVLVLSSGTAR
jgi:hypothetical protein